MKNSLKLESEEDKTSSLYDTFDEATRLSSKSARIEFLTTVRQIEKHLKPGMKILDLGAGTGEYSIYFAKRGYEVTSIEIVEKHVIQIIEKIDVEMTIEVFQGNALDLSAIKDSTYDIILCLGPLYHIEKIEDRLKCIKEIKRVCKENGMMYFAFISNDMVIVTEAFLYNPNFFSGQSYNHESFKLINQPFIFHTVDDCRKLLRDSDLKIISEIAADGLSELFADQINNMDEKSYMQWINYHFYCCEKPEFLGASNHLLFISKKI